MAKYDPLRRYLRRRRGEGIVRLTFAEIERIIGGFLPHAGQQVDWWSHAPAERRGWVHGRAWLEAGFHATLQLSGDVVEFHRVAALGLASEQDKCGRPGADC